MIGGFVGKAVGAPYGVAVQDGDTFLFITDTVDVRKPVDYVLADTPYRRLSPSPFGGKALMKSIFGEK